MRKELEAAGTSIHVVAVNVVGGETTVDALASRCEFDCLQDEASVGAWSLLGGVKDDFFIYREGGRLSAHYSQLGPVNVNLSTEEGYANVRSAILSAVEAGPGSTCVEEPQPGHLRQGDFNADGKLDVSDAIGLLGHLFLDSAIELPCGGTSAESPANLPVLDVNADERADLSDAVYVLSYLFLGDPSPVGGLGCLSIPGCPEACADRN